MGWLIILLLAVAIWAVLWHFGRFNRAALQFLAAALLLALAGYALQGQPTLRGAPAPAPARAKAPPSDFASSRRDVMGRFTRADAWLTMAESYHRAGDTRAAVGIIRSGLRQDPDSVELWVGLGSALVIHGGGMMNPSAELAFRRAAELAPGHPAPSFFYGLSLLQEGRFDEAERVWREQLETAPPGAAYGEAIRARLVMIERAREAGMVPAPRE